jgi:hypothetical protein
MMRLRTLPALLALALAGALVAPAASLACESRQHRCPGMPPELAALCHQAGAAMAPDCCKNERPAPERRAASELAPAPQGAPVAHAELPSAPAAAAVLAAASFSRGASFHALGLFTLHAVFRI